MVKSIKVVERNRSQSESNLSIFLDYESAQQKKRKKDHHFYFSKNKIGFCGFCQEQFLRKRKLITLQEERRTKKVDKFPFVRKEISPDSVRKKD